MFKLLFWVIVFILLFLIFPKIVGSVILLGIVGWVLDEFVMEGIQE